MEAFAKGKMPPQNPSETSCIACGGVMRPWLDMPIDAKTFRATPFGRIIRCARCGLGQASPMPNAASVPSFYKLDAYYTQGASHFAEGERETLADRIRTHIAWRADRGQEPTPQSILSRAGKSSTALRVLDIGCGDGVLLSALAERGCAVAGLDPDPEAVARGNDRLKSKAVRAGGAEDAARHFAGEAFHLIIMSHSLEHCLDPAAALAGVRSVLAPDGAFLCEVPNCAADHFETFNIISEMFDAPRHLWFFTPGALSALFEKQGFKVAETYFHGFTRHFSNAWRATENRIRDKLVETGTASSPVPPKHSRAESAKLLARTMLAAPARKYDCVGVIAKTG